MKHPSSYLEWYVNVPKIEYDLRSSGTAYFNYNLNLGEVDLRSESTRLNSSHT